MALSENKVSVQNFTGGLNTDFHELNTPQNVTVDEANCELDRKGFRKRRLGVQYELGYIQNATQYTQGAMAVQYIKTYQWSNINNSGSLNYMVLQTGNLLSFYDLSFSITAEGLKTFTVDLNTYAAPGVLDTSTDGISVASGNGVLFVVGALIKPFYITYSSLSDNITVTLINLQIRDLIEQDASSANDAQLGALTAGRRYDLYNQGWNTSQVRMYYSTVGPTVEAGAETVLQYYFQVKGYYPPKTAPWWVGKRIGDKGVEVFDPQQYNSVGSGNSLGPTGHFIVDAFHIDRSATSGVAGLPIVQTANRPTAVSFFAGKVFYLLGNTVYYSQTITDTSDLSGVGKCYQDADPTSEQINNLIATDGGTVTIPQSATGIALFNIENSLIVFSTNGTWLISGTNTNSGFSATDYSVNKISDVSCVSSRSLINADGIPIWWAPQGIFTLEPIATKQSFTVKNIALKRVQNFYDTIVPLSKQHATGAFDHIQKRCIWLYNSDPSQNSVTNRFFFNDLLVLDLVFDAYLHHTVSDLSIVSLPSKLVDVFNTLPIQAVTTEIDVIDGAGDIVVTGTGATVVVGDTTYVNTEVVTHDTKYVASGPLGISDPIPVVDTNFPKLQRYDTTSALSITTGTQDGALLLIDGARNRFFAFDNHTLPSATAGVYRFDASTGALTGSVLTSTLFAAVGGNDHSFSWPMTVTFSGDVFAMTSAGNAGGSNGYILVNGNTLHGTLYSGVPAFEVGWGMAPIKQNGIDFVLQAGSGSGAFESLVFEAHDSTLIFAGHRFGIDEGSGGQPMATTTGSGIAYTMAWNNSGTYQTGLYKTVVTSGADGYNSAGWPGSPNAFITTTKIGATLATDIDAGWTTLSDMSVVGYDAADGHIMFFASGSGGAHGTYLVKIKSTDATVVWTLPMSGAILSNFGKGMGINGTLYMMAGASHNSTYYIVDTVAGTLTSATAFNSTNMLSDLLSMYDAASNSVWTANTFAGTSVTPPYLATGTVPGGKEWARYQIGAAPAGPTPLTIAFADFTSTDFHDWSDYTTIGIGADYVSYLDCYYTIAGYMTPHFTPSYDAMMWMYSPYVYVFLEQPARTTSTDIVTQAVTSLPNNSSCLLQTAWDWSSATGSHKWAQQVETYRNRGNFFVATSKNKVRGKGKAMQLRFQSSEGKDFNLLGWGIWYTKNQHP